MQARRKQCYEKKSLLCNHLRVGKTVPEDSLVHARSKGPSVLKGLSERKKKLQSPKKKQRGELVSLFGLFFREL